MSRIFQPGINLKEHLQDSQKRKLVGEAITNFLRAGFYDKDGNPQIVNGHKLSAEMIIKLPPETLQKALAGELISAGDITAGAAVGIQRAAVFFPEVPADTQWLNIFRTINSNKAGETYEQAFAGITFSQLKVGEKPKLGTISQTAKYVPNLKWGAAFGMHREWIDDNEIWKIEEVINEAKIAAYGIQATFMYGLIASAEFSEIEFEDKDTWITVLNKATASLRRTRDAIKSIVLTPNVRPIVLCPVEKTAEILQAIKDSQVVATRGERLQIVPDIIDTAYLGSTDPVFVLVPQRRFIYQNREALRTETDQDIMLDATAYAWYMRNNGVILDKAYGRAIPWSEES